jgi:hypothetical protein
MTTIQVFNSDGTLKEEITIDDNWDAIRADRNIALFESDSWMLSDRGLTEEQITTLTTYRQELRDWTTAYSTVDEAIANCPVKPSFME